MVWWNLVLFPFLPVLIPFTGFVLSFLLYCTGVMNTTKDDFVLAEIVDVLAVLTKNGIT
jgi:hypothetical protein